MSTITEFIWNLGKTPFLLLLSMSTILKAKFGKQNVKWKKNQEQQQRQPNY